MYHNIRWVAPKELGGAPGTTIEASAGPIDSEDNIPQGYAKSILPCTPLAVVKCLEAMGAYDRSLPYGDRLYGKVITVVNRSEVVGRPLAALLSNDGAKVFSADVDSIQEFNKRAKQDGSRKPSETVERARQRIAGLRLRPHHIVRQCNLTLEECIANSDVVISGVPSPNFKIQTSWIKEGAVTVNFSSEKNFEKDVRMRAAMHLPAIGKTTIAMLQRNLLRLVEYRELSLQSSSQSNDDLSGDSSGKGPDDGPNGGPDRKVDHHDSPPSSSRDDNSHGKQSSSTPTGWSSHQAAPEAPRDDTGLTDSKSVQRSSDAASRSPPSSGPDRRARGDSLLHHNRLASGPRERASTLMTQRPEFSREHHTLPHHAHLNRGHAASMYAPQVPWEWRNGAPGDRRDSNMSNDFGSVKTPTSGPSSLLFAPIGSHHTPSQPHAYGASTHHHHQQQQQHNGRPITSQSATSFHSASSPRSATPVSPLIVDGLSVDDSGSSHIPGSQRPSWDSGAPRTPRDGPEGLPHQGMHVNGMPSVLERLPEKEMMQRYGQMQLSSSMEQAPLQRERVVEALAPQGYGSDYRSVARTPQMMEQPLQAHTGTPTGLQPQERIAHSRRRRRPPFSYSSLIAQAISSSPEGRMTLREIYTWISNQYPELYSMEGAEGSGWQNTVRHNLSLNKCFVKVARTAQDIFESCSSGLPNLSQQARGKGGWWTLDPDVAPPLVGTPAKGDLDLDDADEASTSTVRAPQRRRTDSMTMSSVSDDMGTSPATPGTQYFEVGPPSVLRSQHHQQGPGAPGYKVESGGDPKVPSVLQQPQRPHSSERALSSSGPQRANSVSSALRPTAGRMRARGYTTSVAEANDHSMLDMRIPQHIAMASARANHYGTPYTGGHGLPMQSPTMPQYNGLRGPPPAPAPGSAQLQARFLPPNSGLTPASRALSLHGVNASSDSSPSVLSPNKRKSRYEDELAQTPLMREDMPLRSPALTASGMPYAPSPMRVHGGAGTGNLPALPPLHGRPTSASISHVPRHSVGAGSGGGNYLPPPPARSAVSAKMHASLAEKQHGKDVPRSATDRHGNGSGDVDMASAARAKTMVAKSAAVAVAADGDDDDDERSGSRMAIGGLLNT